MNSVSRGLCCQGHYPDADFPDDYHADADADADADAVADADADEASDTFEFCEE